MTRRDREPKMPRHVAESLFRAYRQKPVEVVKLKTRKVYKPDGKRIARPKPDQIRRPPALSNGPLTAIDELRLMLESMDEIPIEALVRS